MPRTGFEPARCYSLPPQSSASAHSATFAFDRFARDELKSSLAANARGSAMLDPDLLPGGPSVLTGLDSANVRDQIHRTVPWFQRKLERRDATVAPKDSEVAA